MTKMGQRWRPGRKGKRGRIPGRGLRGTTPGRGKLGETLSPEEWIARSNYRQPSAGETLLKRLKRQR
jgi:hypothetical protein